MKRLLSAFSILLCLCSVCLADGGYSSLLNPATQSDISTALAVMPGLSPVQSVNGNKGAVVVPTDCVQRILNNTVSITDGTVNWVFPTSPCSFTDATKIGCYVTLAQTDMTYVFAAPVQTALDTSHVTFLVQAAKKTITIGSLGVIPVFTNPPTGTTMNMVCRAPI